MFPHLARSALALALYAAATSFWIPTPAHATGFEDLDLPNRTIFADLEVLNRCDFPVNVMYHYRGNIPGARLGTLRAHERRLFRGALRLGRVEMAFVIALDVPRNLYTQAFFVYHPGAGRRPRPQRIELKPELWGYATAPTEIQPAPVLEPASPLDGDWQLPGNVQVRIAGSQGFYLDPGDNARVGFTINELGFRKLTLTSPGVYEGEVLWKWTHNAHPAQWKTFRIEVRDRNTLFDSHSVSWQRIVSEP